MIMAIPKGRPPDRPDENVERGYLPSRRTDSVFGQAAVDLASLRAIQDQPISARTPIQALGYSTHRGG